jgi:hypothetical protein
MPNTCQLNDYIYVCRDATSHCYGVGFYDFDGQLNKIRSDVNCIFPENYFYDGSPLVFHALTKPFILD